MVTKQGSARKKIVFIVGPTGAGKTEISIKLAKEIGGEIICCDSMQIYKGMDILTAQPDKKQRFAAPHHLFRIKKPTQNFSVAQYRKLALKKIKEIHKRGRVPVFTGGTGLYMSALLDGLFSSPGEDVKLRKRLFVYAQKHGSAKLHERLKKIDPGSAKKIHANDIRRITRALEVYAITGRTMSEAKAKTAGAIYGAYDIDIYCFYYRDRMFLYDRINKRVEKMFGAGILEEIKGLLKLKLSRTASAALGIKQVKGFFDGCHSLRQAKDLLKRDTRRYAKRQMSWFRRDKRVKWIALGLKKA